MKKVLLIALATLAMSSVQANPYNELGCSGCHGVGGKSTIAIYPNLAGQHASYTYKQIKDFQSGVRKDPTMNAMAALTIGKEQEIADFLAKQ
jgi:cytochrome c553